MELIRTRKNPEIRHFRQLARSREYRRDTGLLAAEGEKLLQEALASGAEVREILLREKGAAPDLPGVPVYRATDEVFDFASPSENSPGPLFSLRRKTVEPVGVPRRVLVLENLQDPGNVGTALRTAAAMAADLVVLTGRCADPWQPKTVRGAMGALFRQPMLELELPELIRRLEEWDLPLYGAALAEDARDIRDMDLDRCAVAIGNEGNGLSPEILDQCREKLIIPMSPGSESLNAAVAASIVLWEMARKAALV